jgi:hypothetical protein
MIKSLCCLLIVFLSACSAPRPHPCDNSDAIYKKDLDARYPIATIQSSIETARGKPDQQFLRAAVPPSDTYLLLSISHAELHHGFKVASVCTYMVLNGTGGITSGGIFKDVLLFDAAGKLQWSYRFKLD